MPRCRSTRPWPSARAGPPAQDRDHLHPAGERRAGLHPRGAVFWPAPRWSNRAPWHPRCARCRPTGAGQGLPARAPADHAPVPQPRAAVPTATTGAAVLWRQPGRCCRSWGRPKQQWLVRYGFVDKPAGAALGLQAGPPHDPRRFSELAVHGVTRYCVIDPPPELVHQSGMPSPRADCGDPLPRVARFSALRPVGQTTRPGPTKHDWRARARRAAGPATGHRAFKRLMLSWRAGASAQCGERPRRLPRQTA